MKDLQTIFENSGSVMYIIGLGAWIGLAVLLLKLWHTRSKVVLPPDFAERTLTLLEKGELSAARALAKDDSAAERLAYAALDPELPSGELQLVLEEQGRREIAALARYNGVLATIASISPLLGLLGTILGLIEMFQSLGGDDVSMTQISAEVMAGGIWKALLTTAAGLVVAIPMLLASKWLNARVDRHAENLEDFAAKLARILRRHQEGTP